ncbi:meiosis II protein Mes1 [Schizosaccharomyces cryophilus OY26]|uniref:Meiosis II protein Mes1 n=1 Tax=Schizosaccharomyces cryophilus (strain OY26 / ATCC MYA-4695 / CBS 11777 / NBRC 106824 / NRRL Y48691) TaxID=653667 RepID=S9XB66_SCHCR|nr:meiosis II protein Mes1 [Schizosaccharomyces cryophilus OY26]EPY50981.1 meiosis II protein Mes1 [Schizosaccharomyces cryophilus OY26]
MLNLDNKENEVPFFAKKEPESPPALYRVQRPLLRRPLQELSIEMVPPPSSTSGKGVVESPKKAAKKPLAPSHGFHPYKISTKVLPHSSHTHKQPLKQKSSNRLMSMR